MGYVALALRLGVGGLLLVTGVLKAIDGPAATAATVAGYRLLPQPLVAPFGTILPYLEIIAGGYLVAGLFTRAAAYAAAALALSFTVAVASATARGLSVNCGCFGSGHVEHPTWLHVAGDILLVLASLAIARLGPGPFAFDGKLEARSLESEPKRGTTTA